jgi:predicted site-specific integrase-resolvase
MTKSDLLLSTREFAQKAGVSTGTVSKWLRQGTISGEKTNGKWSISVAELSKVTPDAGKPSTATQPPAPVRSGTSAKTGSGKSFTIQEFSDMTYLTPWGVQTWLKQGRLKATVDAAGQIRVDGSNLDHPDIKRLLR